MTLPAPGSEPFPASIAIAGAWGYIGRKFLDVALEHGLETYVFDPGLMPAEVASERLTRLTDEAEFYRAPAELFHLAVHPEHRRLHLLLTRPEPLLVLVEKPMAEPRQPAACGDIVRAVDAARSIVLYDFPELFDPLTARIRDYLARFQQVRLTEFFVQRSKDREDPANPRNFKRMLPIQYQETVHCLAFVLYLLAAVAGDVEAVLGEGVCLAGESDPYEPPNPADYPHVVDGRVVWEGSLGTVRVEGRTDFKAGAPWAKRRIVRGEGDGAPFEIDVSYLEGEKWLRINGEAQPCDPAANSYAHVLATAYRWSREIPRAQLMGGVFPNPAFTRWTYQLSSVLWRCCHDRREVRFASASELANWDARFADGSAAWRPLATRRAGRESGA